MELAGDEKKIQALFSELRLADEQAAPGFVGVWNRAQLRRPARFGWLKLRFVAAAFVVCAAVLGLARWSNSRHQTAPPINVIAFTPAEIPVTPPVTSGLTPPTAAPNGPSDAERLRALRNLRLARLAARQRAELLAAQRAEIREVTAISSWQSPTATLLSSPNDALLNSLPQLNESVKDLKSFLPNK